MGNPIVIDSNINILVLHTIPLRITVRPPDWWSSVLVFMISHFLS